MSNINKSQYSEATLRKYAKIRNDFVNGMTRKEISEKYNMKESTIRNIIANRKLTKHIL